MGKYIGESVLRKEDPRLVTGEAKYLEDIQLSGMVHAVVKRSDYAHTKIRNIDTSEAEKVPGVIGVWTGKDFEDLNPMPCAWQAGGVDNNANTPRVLEIDKVTFTGQGVAVVVAEDRNIAEDASSKIVVDYEELPTVVSAEEAIKPGAPQLHENASNNICMEWECGNQEGTEKALGEADVVVKEQLVNQRLIPSSMEPRGAIADYKSATEEFTVWMTSQAPHVHRLLATAFVFGIPETKMRVIAAHVGGGFGCKIFLYPEYCLVAALSRKIERPVKWMETRSENFAATTHGRDHVTQIEVPITLAAGFGQERLGLSGGQNNQFICFGLAVKVNHLTVNHFGLPGTDSRSGNRHYLAVFDLPISVGHFSLDQIGLFWFKS